MTTEVASNSIIRWMEPTTSDVVKTSDAAAAAGDASRPRDAAGEDDVTRTEGGACCEAAKKKKKKAAAAAGMMAEKSISPSLLEPFPHQVAGQSLVFRYGADTICKSLIRRELRVYQTMPDVLKPHAPQYRGVVNIALNDTQINQKEKEEEAREAEEEEEEEEEEGRRRKGGANHPLTTQRHLDKVVKSQKEDNVYHFLLLENIVSGFHRPCVLDLKMGTRQHGDDAPSHKVSYQVNKCRTTTSALLGVRLCGMKVFQSATGSYITVDKRQGRRMREHDFRETMRLFLFDGCDMRRELIPVLLLRLAKLKAAIADLPSFRFYASSLLIAYDGRECQCKCKRGDFNACSARLRNGAQQPRPQDPSDCGINGECDKETIDCLCETEDLACSVGCELTSKSNQDTFCSSLLKPECGDQLHETRNLDESHGAYVGQKRTHDVPNEQSVKALRSSSPKNSLSQLRNDVDHLQTPDESSPEDSNDCSVVGNSGTNRKCSLKTELLTKSEVMMEHSPAEQHEANSETARLLRQAMTTCKCCAGLVDVRMVDFAHTTHAGLSEDAVVYQGPDQGCLLGLQTLIDTFTHIYADTDMD